MKIIAIVPMANCAISIYKNLKIGEAYYFYNNFTINGDNFKIEPGITEDFYQKKKPAIDISGIVGKNGSGKSTIVELLIRAINNIARSNERLALKVDLIKDLHVQIVFQTDNYYRIEVEGDKISYAHYDGRSKKFISSKVPLPLQDFFYTIGVNYSHYAYNTEDMSEEGPWLRRLFHKNDGYQTPIVLNPYRNKGNIDINTENNLLKSRLIANLLRYPNKRANYFRSLTTNLEADSLLLKKRENVSSATIYEISTKENEKPIEISLDDIYPNEKRNKILLWLNGKLRFGYRAMSAQDKTEHKDALDYLLYKVISIAVKYYNESYIVFIKEAKRFNFQNEDRFLNDLAKDKSHVTLKLRQTLNYLRFKPDIFITDQPIQLFDIAEYSRGKLKPRKDLEGIELIPPPIFHTEIITCEKGNSTKKVPFKLLSSGEKQIIYSINSLLYHLYNLNSVKRSSYKRTAYNYINIILEEVELYAHPEMQKSYINELLKALTSVDLDKNMELNFIFVTHSPFILSDIPENNILFLQDDGNPLPEEKRMRTFGGNIHDLLCESFFLKNGSIGDFALEKIQTLIESLNAANEKEVKREKGQNENLFKEINLIGEPFLREKILDMYYQIYSNHRRIEQLENELNQLR